MLTKVEAELTNSTLRQTCKLGLTPKDWDSDACRAIPTSQKWKKYVSSFVTYHGYAYMGFTLLRLTVTFARYNISGNFDEAIMHSLLLYCRVGSFSGVATNAFYVDDYLHLHQLTTNFNKKCGLQNFGQEYWKPILREKCLQFFVLCSYGFAGVGALSFMAYPENPAWLYSALPDSYRTKTTLVIFCILETSTILLDSQIFVALNLVYFEYLTCVNFWLKYEWKMDDDELEETTEAYRSIFILNILQRNAFSRIYTPIIKLVAGNASMVSVYVVIQLRGNTGTTFYLMCALMIPVSYFLLLFGAYFMANVYESSVQFKHRLELAAIQSGKEQKLNHVILNTLAPVKCYVSDMYFMDNGAKGALIDWLVNGAMTLFLTLKT